MNFLSYPCNWIHRPVALSLFQVHITYLWTVRRTSDILHLMITIKCRFVSGPACMQSTCLNMSYTSLTAKTFLPSAPSEYTWDNLSFLIIHCWEISRVQQLFIEIHLWIKKQQIEISGEIKRLQSINLPKFSASSWWALENR